jgi:putative redox protein
MIRVSFAGGKRVDAECGKFVVHTDQPPEHGGSDSAPDPFTLFLASVAACAGLYVLAFCQARRLDTAGMAVTLEPETDAAGHLARLKLHVALPPGFPDKYLDSVRRAAETCKVKRALQDPPVVEVTATLEAAT